MVHGADEVDVMGFVRNSEPGRSPDRARNCCSIAAQLRGKISTQRDAKVSAKDAKNPRAYLSGVSELKHDGARVLSQVYPGRPICPAQIDTRPRDRYECTLVWLGLARS